LHMIRRQKTRASRMQGIRKGFTLVELLVVVVVLGVLSGFALASFKDNVGAGQEASVRNDVKNGATAAFNYYYKNATVFTGLTVAGTSWVASPGNVIGYATVTAADVQVQASNVQANRRCTQTVGATSGAMACSDGVYP